MKQSSGIRGDRYAFEVHLNNATPKPDIKRFFLRRMSIQWDATQIVLEDGTAWELYASRGVIDALRNNEWVECMVSFQTFRNGEQIAVARLYQGQNKDKGNCDGR